MAELLQPQYASQFHCSGSACEETCCQVWKVAIDKQTYEKYRKCPDASLRGQLNNCVSRNRVNPTDTYYAKIKHDKSGFCPFLDGDRMCTLQRTLGEEYLSITCSLYPRSFRRVNGHLEMAMTLSCPEVARLVLLNSSPMEFEYTLNPYLRLPQGLPEFDQNNPRFSHKPARYFWELRVFTISLLQNRSYSVWQRLVMLGFFCHVVEQTQGNPDKIPDIIARYTGAIEEGAFRKELEEIPARYDIQGDLLSFLVEYRFKDSFVTPKLVDLFNKAKKAIGLKESMDEQVCANYRNAFEAYYSTFMDKREYILENYLVNYVFHNLFPFSHKGIFDSYVMLVIHYATIKLLLISLTAHYKDDFTDEDVVQLFYSFSRNIEHDDLYIQKVYRLFVDNRLNTMPYMAILIRN